MKLGARIMKTGIAIVLALFVAEALELPSPVFAGIAAVFAVQPTIYRSYLTIIEQIQGNLIGAIIAVSFVILFSNHIVIIGLAAIVTILIILKLQLGNTIGLALVTLIIIMEGSGDSFITFSFIRLSTIMVGVFSSFVINLLFIPPKYETKVYSQIDSITEEILKWTRLTTRHASEHSLLKKDIEKIKEKLIKLDSLYLNYKEERNYFKSNEVAKNRKLVVFRQMIATTRRSFDTLKRLHRFENEVNQLPEEMALFLQEQLDRLHNYHEQLLLKFIGKMRHDINSEAVCLDHSSFTNVLSKELAALQSQQVHHFHILHILTSIMEYEEHLIHLDKLITSFQSFHTEVNELDIKEDE
ncbi:aromatic acid exporter family protein [Bacillus spongiae]|uniref:Aromatic acid exporter family protein n=1 Tax=Bacillus spongiae TaxID=2683610 RepID=A0ABU8HHB5_9BACI